MELPQIDKAENMHPKDIMEIIDASLFVLSEDIKTCVRKEKGKFTMVSWNVYWKLRFQEWGQWSHKLNKQVRESIGKYGEDDKNEAAIRLRDKYRCVYAYWWNRFTYIKEVLSKRPGSLQHKMIKKKQVKYIENARHTLTRLITGEINHADVSPQFNQAIEKFNTMVPKWEDENGTEKGRQNAD